MAGLQLTPKVFRLPFLVAVILAMTSQLPEVRSFMDNQERYHVEVRVYVEPEAFAVWKNISGLSTFQQYSEEIKSYFVEMQKTYDSLPLGYNSIEITFGIENIILMEPDLSHRYDPESTVKVYLDHIHDEYQEKPYDLALLYTGYPQEFKGYGYSDYNTVCHKEAVAIVYQREPQFMVLSMAHHIAHVLGSKHDNDIYEYQPCYMYSGHVMNLKESIFSPNSESFTPCSNRELAINLKAALGEGGSSCLKDGNTVVTGQRLGTLIPPDEYCQRNHYEGHFALRTNISPDTICQTITCVDSKGENKRKMKTLQGMKCGQKKVCNRGVCEESEDGDPQVLDSCPIGEQPRVGMHMNRTCPELKAEECPTHKKECCFTCNPENPIFSLSSDDICSRLAGKNFYMERYYKAHGDDLCSSLRCIKSNDGHHYERKVVQTPNGLACGNGTRCTDGKCLLVNFMKPNVSDYCPHGSQDLFALGYNKNCTLHTKNGCHVWTSACCAECEHVDKSKLYHREEQNGN